MDSKMIEDIKIILDRYTHDYDTLGEYAPKRIEIAHKICQLFEPKLPSKVTFYNERTRTIHEVKGVWEDKTFCFDIPATLE